MKRLAILDVTCITGVAGKVQGQDTSIALEKGFLGKIHRSVLQWSRGGGKISQYAGYERL
jgi:hypothetical protein